MHVYVHNVMYMSLKKFGPPNIKHLPTPLACKHYNIAKMILSTGATLHVALPPPM